MHITLGFTGVVLVSIFAGMAPPAMAGQAEITVSKRDCLKIKRLHASADAAYTPGVDVRGKPVTGANLGGDSKVQIPNEIIFDLGIDLAEKYGIASGAAVEATANLGKITVKRGKVYWNDQPLENPEQQAIAKACAETYER